MEMRTQLVGLVALAFIFMQYVGCVYLPANISAGLVAVIIGTALAWSLGRKDARLCQRWRIDMRSRAPSWPFIIGYNKYGVHISFNGGQEEGRGIKL